MLNFKVTLKEKNKLFDSSFFSFSFRLLMYDFLFSARQLSSPPPCLFFYVWYFMLDGFLSSSNFSKMRSRRISNVSSLLFFCSARSLSYA